MCGGNCNEEAKIVTILGEKGNNGFNGWTPLLGVVNDGERRVHRIIGLTGGTGEKPDIIGKYLSNSDLVDDISLASDIRGAQGLQGDNGTDGFNGWTAETAIITDPGNPNRSVEQIVDWFGGTGDKPSIIDQYIGTTGIVNTPAAASNVRGPKGDKGDKGDQGDIGPQGPSGTPNSTSSSNVAINTTGTKVFTVPAGLSWMPGNMARATKSDDNSVIIEGEVVSYSGTSLTLDPIVSHGTSSNDSWKISFGSGKRYVYENINTNTTYSSEATLVTFFDAFKCFKKIKITFTGSIYNQEDVGYASTIRIKKGATVLATAVQSVKNGEIESVCLVATTSFASGDLISVTGQANGPERMEQIKLTIESI